MELTIQKYKVLSKNKEETDEDNIKIVKMIKKYGGVHKYLDNKIKKTYVLEKIFRISRMNMVDIAKILNNIENMEKNKVIRSIKNEYNISFNDINKIYNLILNHKIILFNEKIKKLSLTHTTRMNRLYKLIYDNLYHLNCFS